LGSATEGRFLDAWKSDFMRRMNALEFIAEPCHKCKYVLKCMSGSRFAALFANKSLYALDPLAEPGNC
jgi:radical SAM protein with 4Fe4S-binding SPASM domain